MTATHVALLRGINVGKAKRIAMAELRGFFERLGFRDVRTLLNSGNVVFTMPRTMRGDPASLLEASLVADTGIAAKVTILLVQELEAAIAANPLIGIATDPSRLLVGVLRNPTDRRRLLPLTKTDWGTEAFALGTRVAYLWCPDGVLASAVVKALDRVLGDEVTSRNWSTVQKLSELAAGQP